MRHFDWSNTEKIFARQAYDRAYERECTKILEKVHGMLSGMEDPKEIWKILVIMFGKLMREGLILDSDIDQFSQDKIDAIKRIASI